MLELVRGAATPRKTLFILDSSFNPPTIAHERLLYSSSLKNGAHMALISTNNVDKNVGGIEHRLKLLDALATSHNDLLVAVTDQPRFIDKRKLIQKLFPDAQLYFIMGMDTISRFFDAKYYNPDEMKQDFAEFFTNSKICWASRDNSHFIPPKQYAEYLIKINVKECSGISSTLARDSLKRYWSLLRRRDVSFEQDSASELQYLKQLLPPTVYESIMTCQFYNDDYRSTESS